MMFKKLILTGLLAASMSIGSVSANEDETAASNSANQGNWMASSAGGNMFDPMAWMSMMSGQSGQGVGNLNLARPEGWATFMNPATYPALMNPGTYAQFMNPAFYMQFAEPQNMMSWMNPASYAAFMNPNTYMQMMNPMAYMQFMNPNTYMQMMNPIAYMQFMNPALYMQWMNPAGYTGAQDDEANANNPFNFNTWAQMFAPKQQ